MPRNSEPPRSLTPLHRYVLRKVVPDMQNPTTTTTTERMLTICNQQREPSVGMSTLRRALKLARDELNLPLQVSRGVWSCEREGSLPPFSFDDAADFALLAALCTIAPLLGDEAAQRARALWEYADDARSVPHRPHDLARTRHIVRGAAHLPPCALPLPEVLTLCEAAGSPSMVVELRVDPKTHLFVHQVHLRMDGEGLWLLGVEVSSHAQVTIPLHALQAVPTVQRQTSPAAVRAPRKAHHTPPAERGSQPLRVSDPSARRADTRASAADDPGGFDDAE